jgi:hypothetical protein
LAGTSTRIFITYKKRSETGTISLSQSRQYIFPISTKRMKGGNWDYPLWVKFNRRTNLSHADDGTLTAEIRKRIAKSVIRRLASEVYFNGRRITLEEVIQEQAHSIGKHPKGKVRYRPFLSRW